MRISFQFRAKALRVLIALVQRIGSRLKDQNGNILCRAFLFSWRGKIHVIGLPSEVHLRPVPESGRQLDYWRQVITWEQAGPPDFARLVEIPQTPAVCSVLHVIICHLPPAQTLAVYERWNSLETTSRALIAYGGTLENFQRLSPSIQAIYVPDASLRTRDHARERQQYAGVFTAAASWLESSGAGITHVHLAEFDVLPLVDDLSARLLNALAEEDADALGYGLVDLTNTIHPHHRYELGDTALTTYLQRISKRELRSRIISMLGCSSFWKRDCFLKVAATEAPRIYLEIAMPTLAHHLGYRIRPMPVEQERFVSFQGDHSPQIDQFRADGAWLAHPCKNYWNRFAAE